MPEKLFLYFIKLIFNRRYIKECRWSLSGKYVIFFFDNLLTIVNKFSIAGYHNNETATIGDIKVFKLIKLITK